VPLLRKRIRGEPDNYSPVSLSSVFGNIQYWAMKNNLHNNSNKTKELIFFRWCYKPVTYPCSLGLSVWQSWGSCRWSSLLVLSWGST